MFDKTDFYNKNIKEVVQKLKLLCDREHLPMFLSIAVADDGEKTKYCNEMISAANAEVTLSDNLLPKFANVLNGFVTLPYANVLQEDQDMHFSNEARTYGNKDPEIPESSTILYSDDDF